MMVECVGPDLLLSTQQEQQQQQCDDVEATTGELPAHASTKQSAPYACYILAVSVVDAEE